MTLLNFSWRQCIQTGKKITDKTKHSTKLNWNDTLFNFSTDDDRKALPIHLPPPFQPLFIFIVCNPIRLRLNCFMHYSYIIMSCTPEHVQNAVVDVWLDKLARLQMESAQFMAFCWGMGPVNFLSSTLPHRDRCHQNFYNQWPENRLVWISWTTWHIYVVAMRARPLEFQSYIKWSLISILNVVNR